MANEQDISELADYGPETANLVERVSSFFLKELLAACGEVRWLDVRTEQSELPKGLRNAKRIRRAIRDEARQWLLGCIRQPCGCQCCENFENLCECAKLDWRWARELFRKVASKGWKIAKKRNRSGRKRKCIATAAKPPLNGASAPTLTKD
jgi:hypothetical protein